MVHVKLFLVLGTLVCSSYAFLYERQISITQPYRKSTEEWQEYFGLSPDPRMLELDVVYVSRMENITVPDNSNRTVEGEEKPREKRILPFFDPKIMMRIISQLFNGHRDMVIQPSIFSNGNYPMLLKRNGDNVTQMDFTEDPCHFTLADNETVASLQNCEEDVLEGYVIGSDTLFEFQPLPEIESSKLKRSFGQGTNPEGWPHVVKRTNLSDIAQGATKLAAFTIPSNNLTATNEDETVPLAAFKSDDPFQNQKYPIIMTEDPEAVGLTFTGYAGAGVDEDYPHFRVPIESDYDSSEDGDDTVVITKKNKLPVQKRSEDKMTVELAVFLDEAGYKLLKKDYMNDDTKIINAVLAIVSGIQAIYHQPSLGRQVDFKVVRLEVFEKQPEDLKMPSNDRDKMLTKFCTFNKKNNPKEDSDPNHWDIGLYLTGEDMYSGSSKPSYSTMGLAVVDGVCREDYSCVVVELGAVNRQGLPYPSTGFGAIYTAAHEIGHNLGMRHDGKDNSCSSEKYLMSPSRGTVGKVEWSSCSRDVIRNMKGNCLNDDVSVEPKNDHAKMYNNNPGQKWDPDMQCQLLLKDSSATLYINTDIKDICQSLYCKSPKRVGTFSAGPAMPGTFCGDKNWCQEGKCVPWGSADVSVTKGGWSEWSEWSTCSDPCIQKSIAVKTRTRQCNNPPKQNSLEGCEGLSSETEFCESECSTRVDSKTFASKKCQSFTSEVSNIKGSGVQMEFDRNDELWVACGVFCELASRKTYYCPRDVMNENAMYPDGTWCFNDGNMDYYCLQGTCRSKSGFQGRGNTDTTIDVLREAGEEGGEKANFIRQYLSQPIDPSAIPKNVDLMESNSVDVNDDYVTAEDLQI